MKKKKFNTKREEKSNSPFENKKKFCPFMYKLNVTIETKKNKS